MQQFLPDVAVLWGDVFPNFKHLGHTAIKPRSVESCSDVFCKFLPSPHTISGAQPKWPSSSWSPFFLPRPFAPISWLGGQLQEESCSKLLLFKTYECHCALEDLQWEALELYFKCQSKRVWILTSMRYFSFSFFIHLHFLNSVSAFSSWCIECRFKWEKKLQHNKSSVAN